MIENNEDKKEVIVIDVQNIDYLKECLANNEKWQYQTNGLTAVFNFVCRPDKSDRDKFDWLSLFATTCVDAVEKMLSSLRSSVIKCACECLPEILLFFPFENDFFQRVLKK